nr:ceramidase domain-containing protein [Polymorphobacter sp.]
MALTLALTALWAVVIWETLLWFGPGWAAYAPATCQPNCFCELPRTGELLLQPANSWSSLGFVAVGGWIALGAANHYRSAFGILPTLWYGLTAVAIGVGSALLHATLTLWGQFADVAGMYLLGAFTLTWAVTRWRNLTATAAIALYLTLVTALIALLWVAPETRRWLFAVLLVVAIAIEWTLARPRRPGIAQHWLLLGLAANALAFALWLLDQSRTLCNPTGWAQGHAAWHLLGAVAVLCSYKYYRSERH